MKKKIVIMGGTLLIAAGAFAVSSSIDSNWGSNRDLLSSNVEALAGNEYSGQTCYNSITTKDNHTVLYCSSCSTGPMANSKATATSGTGTCP